MRTARITGAGLIVLILVSVFCVLSGACSFAASPSAKTVQVKIPLNFAVLGERLSRGLDSSPRLILNDAATLRLSHTEIATGISNSYEQAIDTSAGAQTASFSVSLYLNRSYMLKAEAISAGGTTLYVSEARLDLNGSPASQSVTLNLVPATFETVDAGSTYSTTIESGTSKSYFVKYFGNYQSIDIGSLPGVDGIGYYFQREDGTMLNAVENTVPSLVATKALLGPPAKGFYMVILNQSGSPFSYSFSPVASFLPAINAVYTASVADGANNVYVAGYIVGTQGDTFVVDSGTTATLPFTGSVPILIKYNAQKQLEWYKMPNSTVGTPSSTFMRGGAFRDITLDSNGNIVVVGEVIEETNLEFSGTVNPTGIIPGSVWQEATTGFAAGFSSSGTALWSAAPSSWISGYAHCPFFSVAADGSGYVYVVGQAWSTNQEVQFFNNGTASTTVGGYSGNSPLLVKIDSSHASPGTVVKVISNENTGGSNGDGHLGFMSVAADIGGNVYVVGEVGLTLGNYPYTHTFAKNSGSLSVDTSVGAGVSSMVAAFDSNLNALWGWGSTSSDNLSFRSIAVDSSNGDIYVVGNATGTSVNVIGPVGATANLAGVYGSGVTGTNPILIHLNESDGSVLAVAQFATASSDANFNDVAVINGTVTAVGYIGTGGFSVSGISFSSNLATGNGVLVATFNGNAGNWQSFATQTIPSSANAELFGVFAKTGKTVLVGKKTLGLVNLGGLGESEPGGAGLLFIQ